jgi:glutaconate CoA-transferase subunit B
MSTPAEVESPPTDATNGRLDFQTSGSHMEGGDSRERMRFPGEGPTAVITDWGIMTPDPVTKELTLTSVHPGVNVDYVVAATGWKFKVASEVSTTPKPTKLELTVLRDLQARTARAHAGQD